MNNKNNNQAIEMDKVTWHEKHQKASTLGARVADSTASLIGSWRFIIIQTIVVIVWMFLNVVAFTSHWDVYPFVLLNLLFSTQAAYAAPIIMMAQNRQNDRDRYHAREDYRTNLRAKKEIEELQKSLARIESEKLDKILELIKKSSK